jgi:type IV secretory pathway TraG/TraD family ATPase VirD4
MSMLNKARAFEGFETFLNGLKMTLKMVWLAFWVVLLVQIAFFVLLMFIMFSIDELKAFCQLAWSMVVNKIWPSFVLDFITFGRHWEAEAAGAARILSDFLSPLVPRMRSTFKWSFFVWLLWPIIVGYFASRSAKQSARRHVRGAQLISEKDLIKQLRNAFELTDIPLGCKVKMPRSAEVKHVFTCGRPGVGKTTSYLQIIERLIERGEKIIIYDFKGDYLTRFYNPSRDLIFNPLDARGIKWSVMKELKSIMDIESVATSLIPQSMGQDSFWDTAARSVFAACLLDLHRQGFRKNSDIWKAVSAPAAEIEKRLRAPGCERGYRYIEDADSKMAKSVLAVLMQYAQTFEYMGDEEDDFTVDSWLTNGKGGCIFVTSYAEIQDALRPILSLFVDLFGRRLLSMPDDHDRRVFILLDEFGTLQRLSTIVRLLTLSRSKGGSVWLGIQDVGQIDRTYGEKHRQAIVNACSASLLFSVADPDTAEYLSRKIGDTEYLEAERTHSMGVADNRDGLNIRDVKRLERLVLPSELARLPDFQFYLSLPGQQIVKTSLNRKSIPHKAEPFVMRAGLSLDEIQVEYSRLAADAEVVRESKLSEVEKKNEESFKDKQINSDDDSRNISITEEMDF